MHYICNRSRNTNYSKDYFPVKAKDTDTFSIFIFFSPNNLTVLGDIELYNINEAPLLVEAKTTVLCLTLSISIYKEKLLKDNEFLRFIVKELSKKLSLCTKSEALFSSLEEKFLHYITEECENSMITSVENTAYYK